MRQSPLWEDVKSFFAPPGYLRVLREPNNLQPLIAAVLLAIIIASVIIGVLMGTD